MLLLPTEFVSAVTTVLNLLRETDVCGLVGRWLSNFYDVLLVTNELNLNEPFIDFPVNMTIFSLTLTLCFFDCGKRQI